MGFGASLLGLGLGLGLGSNDKLKGRPDLRDVAEGREKRLQVLL